MGAESGLNRREEAVITAFPLHFCFFTFILIFANTLFFCTKTFVLYINYHISYTFYECWKMGHSASAKMYFVVLGDFAFSFLQNYTV